VQPYRPQASTAASSAFGYGNYPAVAVINTAEAEENMCMKAEMEFLALTCLALNDIYKLFSMFFFKSLLIVQVSNVLRPLLYCW